MNTPVSFKLAKLLKEKDYDKPCRTTVSLQKEGHVYNDRANEVIDWNNFIPTTNPALGKCFISAPTIAEVVMWLYEKHGIWIQPFILNKKFAWKVAEIKREITWCLFSQEDKGYNSPTEAYEAAIEYTLTKII